MLGTIDTLFKGPVGCSSSIHFSASIRLGLLFIYMTISPTSVTKLSVNCFLHGTPTSPVAWRISDLLQLSSGDKEAILMMKLTTAKWYHAFTRYKWYITLSTSSLSGVHWYSWRLKPAVNIPATMENRLDRGLFWGCWSSFSVCAKASSTRCQSGVIALGV